MTQFVMVILKDAEMAGLPLDSEDLDTISFFEKSLYKAKQHASWVVGEINKQVPMATLNQESKLISVSEIKSQ